MSLCSVHPSTARCSPVSLSHIRARAPARRAARDCRRRARRTLRAARRARCARPSGCTTTASGAALPRGSLGAGRELRGRRLGLRRPGVARAHGRARACRAWTAGAARSSPLLDLHDPRPAQHARGALAATSPPTTTSATTCSGCSSTTTMTYSCALFESPEASAARGPGGEARPRLPQARAGPGRSPAGDRHRLGLVRAARRRALRLPRHDHDDLARAARGGDRAGARGRARGQGEGAPERLPRPARALRQARVDRDDRGGRLAVLRHLLPPLRRAARARRPDAAAGDHDRRPRLRGREGLALVHQRADLPLRVPALARGDLAAASRA